MPKVRRPRPGDTLGFVGPSGAVPDLSVLPRAARGAEHMGFKVRMGESCAARYGYLSGDDALRAADLNGMFLDDSVDAIVCVRGGYGTPRILDRLDYEAARAHPKLLWGYSDITALHLAYRAKSDLATVHGPMPTGDWISEDFAPHTQSSMRDCLENRQAGAPLANPPGHAVSALSGGACEGTLVGGNLTLICSLLGTPYLPDLRGAILLLEDVDERLYRIDRMLTQLRLAGAFDQCAGVALGGFTRCEPEYEDCSLSLEEILRDTVLPSGKPVLAGLMIGHCRPKLTVPLGIRYRLDADAGSLTPLESAFFD